MPQFFALASRGCTRLCRPHPMTIGARLALIAVGVPCLFPPPAACEGPIEAPAPAAFFSRHFQAYAVMENLSLMRGNKVLMHPHGVVDISGFAWRGYRGPSAGWMLGIEELVYLLPFIGSEREEDRGFAVDWFRRWDRAHAGGASPNRAAWDGMTTGTRAAVLAYFLEMERRRASGGISDELTETLIVHRRVLVDGRFDDDSNHGVWEAIGLIETGRALSDADAFALGVSRLEGLADNQVSALGFHMEHAAGYHFTFLKWLDKAIEYLDGVAGVDERAMARLRAVRARMIEAGYFLQDHAGLVLPIGDSSRSGVSPAYRVEVAADGGTTKFDAEAGYACYKEPSHAGSGRQVVFNIQPEEQKFPFHFHDDALALVLLYRGESILGDQGAYDYGRSHYRRLLVSAAAHNSVGPTAQVFSLDRMTPRVAHAESVEFLEGDDVVFSARRVYRAGEFARHVTIPRGGALLVIDDAVTGMDMSMVWNLGTDIVSATEAVVPAAAGFDRHWLLSSRVGRVFELAIACPRLSAVRGVRLLCGSQRPMAGWYSPSYQKIVKSQVLVIAIDSPESVDVRTTLRLVEDVDPPPPEN